MSAYLSQINIKHIDEVDKPKIKGDFSKKKLYRYSLEIPFHQSEIRTKIASVILKNPSSANTNRADTTINRIENYIFKNLPDVKQVNILNLYAFRATETIDLADEIKQHSHRLNISQQKNNNIIEETLKNSDYIIKAWGGWSDLNRETYDQRVEELLNILNQEMFRDKIFQVIRPNTIENETTSMYPLHGQVWGYKYPLHQNT